MVNSIILAFAIALFIILAGLFAGAETGIYQLSRIRLRVGIAKKHPSSLILAKVMHDSSGLLLSLLAGDNLAHYLATSFITYMLLSRIETEHTAELFATLITAPILFIFSELIPKNIFFYRADSLMPLFAPVLFAFHKLFTYSGVVPLLKFFSAVFAKLTGTLLSARQVMSDVKRHHIKAILQETREEDVLSPIQTDIINRIISVPQISVTSVMTPVNKVRMVAEDSDTAGLLNKLRQSAFTRLPVYSHSPANIIGFINVYEALSSTQKFTDVHDFIKPIRRLPAHTAVIDAIHIMQRENEKIVLVTKDSHAAQGKPVGIVTMKDLVEELLGELTEW